MSINRAIPSFVIPAKAGIHHLQLNFRPPVMDPRLRGGDEVMVGGTAL
jgi:hypothetical protein